MGCLSAPQGGKIRGAGLFSFRTQRGHRFSRPREFRSSSVQRTTFTNEAVDNPTRGATGENVGNYSLIFVRCLDGPPMQPRRVAFRTTKVRGADLNRGRPKGE